METIPITSKIKKIVGDVVSVAISYEEFTGRKLGITGEIGEILVCNHKILKPLELKWLRDSIAAGYDAIDKNKKRYQIKATRNERGRLSKFSMHKFDFAVMAIFDERYVIKELWQASYKILKSRIVRHRRRNPSVQEFKRFAKKIF